MSDVHGLLGINASIHSQIESTERLVGFMAFPNNITCNSVLFQVELRLNISRNRLLSVMIIITLCGIALSIMAAVTGIFGG